MSTTVQKVAMVFGVVAVLIAIVGFITPGGMVMSPDAGSGMLLGMFPVNLLHNVVHLILGIWGIAAARSFSGAKSYAQTVGVLYILLAVVGWWKPDGFGFVPLGGRDIWLHCALGVILLIVGLTAKAETASPATA